MKTTAFRCYLVASIVATFAFTVRAEVIVIESKDETSEDLPLTFDLEKTTWDGDDIHIWGTTRNTGKVSYKYVKVIFTVRDKDRKFIGRQSWHADPNKIGPGQVGYIEDNFVECERRKPAIIEFNVVGSESK